MQRLVRFGAIVDDPFVLVREAASLADLPEATPVIVPLGLWTSARAVLSGSPRTALRAAPPGGQAPWGGPAAPIARGDVGVWLSPADDPAALAADVRLLQVIAVDFPSFTDGRGYSIGRLLRERYGYTGELRAIGDIQRDQLYYLAQVGFDAFAVREGHDADAAIAGLSDFADGYQVTNARTPWFRRRAAAPGECA